MKNASYNDAVAFDPVKELIRKAADEHATKTAIVNGIALRIANQSLERSFDFRDELGAQSNAMTLYQFWASRRSVSARDRMVSCQATGAITRSSAL